MKELKTFLLFIFFLVLTINVRSENLYTWNGYFGNNYMSLGSANYKLDEIGNKLAFGFNSTVGFNTNQACLGSSGGFSPQNINLLVGIRNDSGGVPHENWESYANETCSSGTCCYTFDENVEIVANKYYWVSAEYDSQTGSGDYIRLIFAEDIPGESLRYIHPQDMTNDGSVVLRNLTSGWEERTDGGTMFTLLNSSGDVVFSSYAYGSSIFFNRVHGDQIIGEVFQVQQGITVEDVEMGTDEGGTPTCSGEFRIIKGVLDSSWKDNTMSSCISPSVWSGSKVKGCTLQSSVNLVPKVNYTFILRDVNQTCDNSNYIVPQKINYYDTKNSYDGERSYMVVSLDNGTTVSKEEEDIPFRFNYSSYTDSKIPFYSSNSSVTDQSGITVHNLFWEDDNSLHNYIFSYCDVGKWNGATCTGSGFINVSYSFNTDFNFSWSNITYNTNGSAGQTIAWCVYANDTSGNMNSTSCSNPFTYVAYSFPSWKENQTNTTKAIAGTDVLHSVNWTANSGTLSGYIFSFDNCTGTFVNDSYVSFGSSSWSNVTKNINTTSLCTVRWTVYANNSFDLINQTDIFSYITYNDINYSAVNTNNKNKFDGTNTTLNITWTLENPNVAQINNVLIQINDSSSYINYTAQNTGDVYWISRLLGKGNYSWTSFANTTEGIINQSNYTSFGINMGDNGCHINFTTGGSTTTDDNRSIDSDDSVTTTGYCDGADANLYYNGNSISNPHITTHGVGTQNYTVNTSGNGNWSANSILLYYYLFVTSPSVSTPPGGGGGSTSSSGKVLCDIEVNPVNMTFYQEDLVLRLLIKNNENFSFSPTYTMPSENFELRSAHEIILGGATVESSVLRNYKNNSNITETLTISSPECDDVTVSLSFLAQRKSVDAIGFIKAVIFNVINTLQSKVSIFSLKVPFFVFTIIIAALTAFLLYFAKVKISVKIFSGLFIILLLNILLSFMVAPADSGTTEVSEYFIDNTVEKSVDSYSYTKDVLMTSAFTASFLDNDIEVPIIYVAIPIFLIITGLMFAWGRFDWWANIIIGLIITLLLIIAIYYLLRVI